MGCTAATTVVAFSSGSKCDGLEITGAGTSLAGAGAEGAGAGGAETGTLAAGWPAAGAAEPMGKIFSTSVSRMMVLTAYLTALFSAFAMMAAAVPYVLSGGLCDIPDGPPVVALSFSKVFSTTLSMILAVLVSMVLLFLITIPTELELVDITEVTLVVTTIGVGVDTVGGGIGVSGAVSESTIAVMGELENALFEDCEESSSLSVSDSELFSCSSSMGSSSSSFSGVPSLWALIEAGSSSRGGVEAPAGGMLFSSSSVARVGP